MSSLVGWINLKSKIQNWAIRSLHQIIRAEVATRFIYGGNVTYETCMFSTDAEDLEEQPWWGNSELAGAVYDLLRTIK